MASRCRAGKVEFRPSQSAIATVSIRSLTTMRKSVRATTVRERLFILPLALSSQLSVTAEEVDAANG